MYNVQVAMTSSDNKQLYEDVAHCLDVLVENLTTEIEERVSDLIVDGRIKITDFFERFGVEPDGCEQHIFLSSYQKDILKRVEGNLATKGYVSRVTVSGKYVHYTTRIPHPWKRLAYVALALIVPMLSVPFAAYRVRAVQLQQQEQQHAPLVTSLMTEPLWAPIVDQEVKHAVAEPESIPVTVVTQRRSPKSSRTSRF
jgi:hypothetical protein